MLGECTSRYKGERKKENLPVRDEVECATGSGRKHRSESESITQVDWTECQSEGNGKPDVRDA